MRRLGIVVLALAVLTALLGSCGGGDEAGVLAVAFRLDEGSPVMSAYMGDPAKDPFWLPAGRYYIEALDEDEVFLSLGAVDIEDGQAASLPASLTAAGGVADPGRAEPVITVANFLVDVELSKYTLLEMVSGGFEQPLFDPDVEIAAADLETLFGMYEDILAQENGVVAALDEIERRAEVSLGVSYVLSGWAPAMGDLDKARDRAAVLFGILGSVAGVDEEKRQEAIADALLDLAQQHDVFEAMPWGDLPHTVESSSELDGKRVRWHEYARDLALGISTAEDWPGRQKAMQELAAAIRSDLQKWLHERGAEVSTKAIDWCASSLAYDVFVSVAGEMGEPSWIVALSDAAYGQVLGMSGSLGEAGRAASELKECLTFMVKAGASDQEAKDYCVPPSLVLAGLETKPAGTSWIEWYVQVIGEQWVDEGYGVEAVVAEENLRVCLTGAAEAGASRDEAIAQCPAKAFKPKLTPQPTETPASEETETPTSEESETPTAEETETPTAEETETPTPQGQDVTATGQLTDLYDPSKITANSISLRFNTQGGSVSGEAHFEKTYTGSCRTAGDHYIDGTIVWTWDIIFSGIYSKDTGQLDGTAQITFRHVTCQRGAAWSEPWSAALQGGQVAGRLMEDCDWVATLYNWPNSTPECLPGAEDRFELTVQ